MPHVLRSTARLTSRLAVLTALALLLSLLQASAAPAASALAPMSPGMARLADSLAPTAQLGAFVHFADAGAAERAALLTSRGLRVTADFPDAVASYAVGTLSQLLDLRDVEGVTYLEDNRKLEYFGDTAPWTTGARVARTAVANGPYSVNGKVIDGTGVGVAVVDSGIDGLHPDLSSHIAKSYKVACSTPGLINTTTGQCFGPVVVQEAAFSDNTGGHGTHVSGIAVGDGTASNGTYQGVAPKAKLFSYGVGETLLVLYNVEAFQHMLTNYDTLLPKIKVVNNSYGDAAGSAYDFNSVFSKLTRALIDKGVSIVFAAGNGDANGDGGTGADDRLSSTAKDPTPGVITAANYVDGGTANRNGSLDSSSSRGKRGVPTEYPDLSAPGNLITSTCNPALPVCRLEVVPTVAWAPRYATISGTSMASPHIAGAVALLYQARPSLTPAQVEKVLQDTAYKFVTPNAPYEPDPQNPGSTTSFDKGAGLLDVTAALDKLGVDAANRPATSAPSITTATPAAGTVNDGTTSLTVSGSANDGLLPPPVPATRTVALGDGGDLPAPSPGAADLASLSLLETSTGINATIAVRNLSDVAPGQSMRLLFNLGGIARATSFSLSATAITPSAYNAGTNNVLPTAVAVDRANNRFTLSLPFNDPDGASPDTSLGRPAAGELMTNTRVISFVSVAVDQLPGGVGTASTTAPEYGAPFQVQRPGLVPPPVATVTVAVDAGAEQPAVLAGSSPSYGYTATIDTTGLTDGSHVLTQRLYLAGALAANDTRPFTVARPRVITSSVAFSSPAEGATVNRGVVDVSGTAMSDAPAVSVRSVQLQVSGSGYSPAPVTASGTTAWTTPVDFSALPAGNYLLTATLLLDGSSVATATRSVVVPAAPAPETLVSCAPQALKFWRNEFSGGSKVAFTPTERQALAAKAAQLSDGYFADARTVTNTLYAQGKITPELSAARHYAALLLDLAAGRLSSGYSRQLGLSGSEPLKASSYDVARVGSTVAAATTWVRGQLGSGDNAAAETVATRITRAEGLGCPSPAGSGASTEHDSD